jgi:hypothetical protein
MHRTTHNANQFLQRRPGVSALVLVGTALAASVAATCAADVTTIPTPNPTGGGEFGDSVALIGDVNGDGYSEFAVGAPDEDLPGIDEAGRVYVYNGRTLALIRIHNSPNPEIVGWFGEVVLGLGDINGDGRADYAIAAPNQGANVEGDLYVYSGMNGGLLYSVNGWFYRTFGELSLVPDATGDGLPELAVGYAGPGDYASVRVLQAKNGVLWRTLNSPIPSGDISGFGLSVSGVPDVTGDGKGDVVVGAPDAAPGAAPLNAGRVYVFNGATGALWDTIQSTDQQENGRFGAAVAGLPDVTGDGRGDIVVGAQSEIPDGSAVTAGQVHLHSGATGNFVRTYNSTDPTSGGDFGLFVAATGDWNSDGKADFVVGARDENVGGSETGRVYVFSGGTPDLVQGFNAPGTSAERFGDSLDASKDLNLDGIPDLIVGAPSTDVGASTAAGTVYLWRDLENDACSLFSPPTAVGNGTHPFSTVGASTSGPLVFACGGSDQIDNDVFFSYTATCTGALTVTTCSSADFDTKIAVYQGCGYNGFPLISCNLETLLDCNDDTAFCSNFTSRVVVPVVAGQCYRIRIGGYNGAIGSGTFTISCAPQCAGDVNLDGKVDGADLAVLLGQWGSSGSADFDGSGQVNGADLAILLGAWGTC